MKLATIRAGGGTRAVRVDDDVLTDVGATDVGTLLGHADWAQRGRSATAATAATYPAAGANYAPVVPQPSKVICVVSTIVRLCPGDIIATGTPGGVGHAREPQRFLVGGEIVVTEIEGLGRLENLVATMGQPLCDPVIRAARSSGFRNDGGGGGPQLYSPRAPSRTSGFHSWSSGMQSMSE